MTPISDDMVEKAARGIAALVGNDSGSIWKHMKPVYLREARAALTAALEGSVAVPVDLARAVAERDHWRDLVPRADRAQFPFDADALPRHERVLPIQTPRNQHD